MWLGFDPFRPVQNHTTLVGPRLRYCCIFLGVPTRSTSYDQQRFARTRGRDGEARTVVKCDPHDGGRLRPNVGFQRRWLRTRESWEVRSREGGSSTRVPLQRRFEARDLGRGPSQSLLGRVLRVCRQLEESLPNCTRFTEEDIISSVTACNVGPHIGGGLVVTTWLARLFPSSEPGQSCRMLLRHPSSVSAVLLC